MNQTKEEEIKVMKQNFEDYKKSIQSDIDKRLNVVKKKEKRLKEQRLAMDKDVKKY